MLDPMACIVLALLSVSSCTLWAFVIPAAGTIPATWTQPSAFPSLINLALSGNGLSGGWNDIARKL